MPNLTRRRYSERRDCWHVYFGDVCVGTIGRRAGCPVDVDQWEWSCGFYPGTGQGQNGTTADFETCRVEFEATWRRLLPKLTEASFQQWRDQRDRTALKYAMWGRGERMPTQKPNSVILAHAGRSLIATIPRAATFTVGISMRLKPPTGSDDNGGGR
jgi:hypothetical protein